MHYAKELFQGNKSVAIIGLGYLGYSDLIQYLKAGISCVVTDFNKDRLEEFKNEDYPPKDRFLFWKSMSEIKMNNSDLLSIVEPEQIINEKNTVYLICTPFGHNLSPSSDHLKKIVSLFEQINEVSVECKPLVIFESFFKPFSINKIIIPALLKAKIDIKEKMYLIYAPRNDWFFEDFVYGSKERLVGSVQKGLKEELEKLFQLINKKILYSENVDSVEIAECMQNSFAFLGNSLISQLMFAFPEQNIHEAVDLAGLSKYGIVPSIFSGVNLPISGQFLLDTATRPSYLSLLVDAISSGYSIQQYIVEYLKRKEITKVAILGLLPHENTPEYANSPSLLLPRLLKDAGMDVKVHDPFLSSDDIKENTRCDYLDIPAGLGDRQAILLLTSHDCYKALSRNVLSSHLKNCRFVLDNTGIWKNFDLEVMENLDYKIFGHPFSVFD